MIKKLILASSLLFSVSPQAKTVWSDFSLTYLQGSNYEVGDSNRDVMTFEYVSGTTWGDTFLFFDRLESDNGDTETYGEFSPRIKFSEYSNSVLSGIYFAPSVEIGQGFTNYLAGISTDISVPGFNYVKATAFARDNQNGDNSFQLTLVWGLPVGPLYYDGFIDYATSVKNTAFGDTEATMNFTSQLKYDVSNHLGLKSKMMLGIEYVYWNNKYGIKDVNERNLNLLLKYHF